MLATRNVRRALVLCIGGCASLMSAVSFTSIAQEPSPKLAALLVFSKNIEETKRTLSETGMAGMAGLTRGETVTALVGGYACRAAGNGRCQVKGRIWGETPTGGLWFDYKDLLVYDEAPPPITSDLDGWFYSGSALVMSLEPQEVSGDYRIHLEITDEVSGQAAGTVQVLQTKEVPK